jgi:hypothetical protein
VDTYIDDNYRQQKEEGYGWNCPRPDAGRHVRVAGEGGDPRIFGRERGRLRAAGLTIGDFDLLIAATALQYDLTLLTNNRRHFERVEGLRIESV